MDFAHRLPTATIAFELLAPSTTAADILAGPSLRGSKPDHTTTIAVFGKLRTLYCRRGDIVDECFVMIPLGQPPGSITYRIHADDTLFR